MMPAIDQTEFVSKVRPLLERQDVHGLIGLLKGRWSCDQISHLLLHGHDDVRKVAALCLALVGKQDSIKMLAEQLKNPDPTINQMAEHALWSIWFRCGTPQANTELCLGTKAMNNREFARAMMHFARAIELDPDFAEAYNQRAIALYLQEDYEQSAEDCRRAVERMPCHFGAWAGMGHSFLHIGQLDKARQCYAQALKVNPHLECLKQTIAEIDNRLNGDISPLC